ncbi:uncharacterized protein [Amphiura filiformis]|uniref:uncharacterized protein isoform X3 n=1 Tax=Amphiura filiformis TaxID=82378 RepID=UPI003B21FC36
MKNPEIGSVKIGIYAGVGAVVAIALIISIIIAAFVVSSRMQPKRRDRYRGAKKKKKGNTLERPRYPSPPPSPVEEVRTTLSSIQSQLNGDIGDQSDSEKHDYENLPKGFRNGLCAKSPVYQSPVSAC